MFRTRSTSFALPNTWQSFFLFEKAYTAEHITYTYGYRYTTYIYTSNSVPLDIWTASPLNYSQRHILRPPKMFSLDELLTRLHVCISQVKVSLAKCVLTNTLIYENYTCGLALKSKYVILINLIIFVSTEVTRYHESKGSVEHKAYLLVSMNV